MLELCQPDLGLGQVHDGVPARPGAEQAACGEAGAIAGSPGETERCAADDAPRPARGLA